MDSHEAKRKLRQAADLHKQGKSGESLALLKEVEKTYPGNEHVLYGKATCLVSLGRTVEAVACCKQLEGRLPEERLAVLRKKIQTHQVPQRAASPGKPRRFAPVATLPSEKPWPKLVPCGYAQGDPDGMDIFSDSFLSKARVLSDDGWRAFVALVERLMTATPTEPWHTSPDIPEDVLKDTLTAYEDVFEEGELVVAVCKHMMLTDRRLYYLFHTEEPLASAVAWGDIEAVTILPTKKTPAMTVRRRDGQHILIHFVGCEKMAAPFAEFLNEVSLVYEPEGSAMVVLPLDVKEVRIPNTCCNCMAAHGETHGAWLVKDPAAPLVKVDMDEDGDDEERHRRMKGLGKKVGRAFLRALVRDEDALDEVYASSDPGLRLKLCPFCSMEQPVRVTRLQDRLKIIVCRNAEYAALLADKNTSDSPQDG